MSNDPSPAPPSPSAWSERRLDVLSIALFVLGVGFWMWLISRGWKVGSGPWSDFSFFYHAAVAARTGDNMYVVHDAGYVYPPLLAVLLVPLGKLDLVTAAHVWTVFLAAMLPFAACVWTSALIHRLGLSLSRLSRWAVIAVAVLLLGQTWKSEFQYGNSNLLLILCTGLALRDVGKRPAVVGLCLAFAVSIKYFPIVVVPYLLIRGRWRECAWFVACIVVLNLLPALYLGWSRNLECLTTALRGVLEMLRILPKSGGAGIIPVDAGYSLSITSTMSRWEKWLDLPPKAGLFASGAVAAACFALGAWMYRRTRTALFVGRVPKHDDPSPRYRAAFGLEYTALLAAAVVFSPQGTHRHLNMLLPLAILAVMLVRTASLRVQRLAAAASAAIFVLGAAAIPGVPAWRRATELWNQGGGAACCTLTLLFTVIWVGLHNLPPHTRTDEPR